jgi:hypothetical protein
MTVGEWDQRQLCPDGTCTGLIGDDGLCKVCGRAAPNWGDERNRGKVADVDEPEGDDEGDDEDADDEEEGDDDDDAAESEHDAVVADAPTPAAGVDDYEWTRRKLCPDGACTGVLGGDGKCKVCGRSAA